MEVACSSSQTEDWPQAAQVHGQPTHGSTQRLDIVAADDLEHSRFNKSLRRSLEVSLRFLQSTNSNAYALLAVLTLLPGGAPKPISMPSGRQSHRRTPEDRTPMAESAERASGGGGKARRRWRQRRRHFGERGRRRNRQGSGRELRLHHYVAAADAGADAAAGRVAGQGRAGPVARASYAAWRRPPAELLGVGA